MEIGWRIILGQLGAQRLQGNYRLLADLAELVPELKQPNSYRGPTSTWDGHTGLNE